MRKLRGCLILPLVLLAVVWVTCPAVEASQVEWTANPNLVVSQDKWDCRIWHWWNSANSTVLVEPDANNFCVWSTDGTVDLQVYDLHLGWFATAVSFDQGTERNSIPPSYQPTLIAVTPWSKVTLQADLEDYTSFCVDFLGWAGVKIDVWAVESLMYGGRKLMVEMYISRAGWNCLWPSNAEYTRQTAEGDVWNYLVNLNDPAFCGIHANRTINGSQSTWSIDVKYFLQRGATLLGWDINTFFMSKVSFAVEAWNGFAKGTAHKLRVFCTADEGPGCPYLYVWNGQRYIADNNLLPAAEVSNGTDVDDFYKLEQGLVPTHEGTSVSLYSLRIVESEHEHDYFDEIGLSAVDHAPDTNVAVTPTGEALTYKNPVPPVSATDENGEDVLSSVESIGEGFYEGHSGSYVELTFNSSLISDNAKLVIRADIPPIVKSPVYVQAENATGQWSTIATFFTRANWATNIIDMTDYWPDTQGDLKARLCFVSTDKIDFVGLDNTPQEPIHTHKATLLLALHSAQGNVKPLLATCDKRYAELTPGEFIQLTFLLPTLQDGERTFILYARGHYETIE